MNLEMIVIPAPLLEALQHVGFPLASLTDRDALARHLSARDLASIELACEEFPYKKAWDQSGLHLLRPFQYFENREAHAFLYNRVKELLATAGATATPASVVHTYTLHKPIGDKLWVAVQQRLSHDSDPSEQRLSSNIGFLEDVIEALLLHCRGSIESIAHLPIFSSYLQELTKAAPAA